MRIDKTMQQALESAKREADEARLAMSLHRQNDPDQPWRWRAEAADDHQREAVCVVLPACWWD